MDVVKQRAVSPDTLSSDDDEEDDSSRGDDEDTDDDDDEPHVVDFVFDGASGRDVMAR